VAAAEPPWYGPVCPVVWVPCPLLTKSGSPRLRTNRCVAAIGVMGAAGSVCLAPIMLTAEFFAPTVVRSGGRVRKDEFLQFMSQKFSHLDDDKNERLERQELRRRR